MRTVRLATVCGLVTTGCQHWWGDSCRARRGGAERSLSWSSMSSKFKCIMGNGNMRTHPVKRQTDRHQWKTYLPVILLADANKTKMHSSRMRTSCTLTIGWRCTCPGNVLGRGGVPAQGVGVYLPRVIPSWSGVPAQGALYLPGEVYLPGEGICWGSTYPGTPPPVNRMTDRWKNITLSQTSFAGGENLRLWQ